MPCKSILILFIVATSPIAYSQNPSEPPRPERSQRQAEPEVGPEDGELRRIEFENLPEAVRKKARQEFPEQRLMAVELSGEGEELVYHVMFDLDGREAGLRLDPEGTIIDRWHFEADENQEASARPTHMDIEYGPHDRNVLDLWLAESEEPTPLLICIHGGGFSSGDKDGYREDGELLSMMLEAGISVAAINYRLTEGGKNPYPIPMHDGARAVQFLRHHAEKYNLDKNRFGATGGSAGGCMLMWLGFHPDLSNPDDKDPVCRESSRLQVLAPVGGQSSLHLPTLAKWFGVESLQVHPAYWPLLALPAGEPIKMTDQFEAAMLDASPITHLSADDPPIYLGYGDKNVAITEETSPGVWVHHPVMGIQLKEAMDQLNIECQVDYPGGEPESQYSSQLEFIIRKLIDHQSLSD